jgi:hypothetical protein
LNKQGYTLLEVTLFLAISSSLALIAFVGLGPKLRNVRFTDSVRGVEASITRAIADSKAGSSPVNDTKCVPSGQGFKISAKVGNPPGISQDCVLSGVWIYFKDSSIQYYQVTSLRTRNSKCPDDKAIQNAVDVSVCFGARPIGDQFGDEGYQPKTYNLTNGLTRTKAKDESALKDTFVGYVVDPSSNQPYIFIEGQEGDKPTSKKICYQLNNRKASINFSTGSIEPRLEFDDAQC